jgi:hypothetical protein
MMFFGDGQFPKCGSYMRSSIVGMNKKSKIYKALVECIEDEKLVALAVSPGTYPRLIIEDLIKGMYVIDGIYQGECDPTKLNYVYLHTRVGDGFEHYEDHYPPAFERLLLHEVVHWGRFLGGKPGEIDGREAGSWFEHLAYDIPYKWHGEIKCT